MLCETCKSIFHEFVDSYGSKSYMSRKQHSSRNHHQTIEKLHKAAAAHCQICVQLFLNLQRHYWSSFAPGSTLSAPEKAKIMIREMMLRQKLPSSYINTHLLTCDASISTDDIIRLFFITQDHHLNTLRNSTGYLPNTLSQSFISVQSKVVKKYTLTHRYSLSERRKRNWDLELAKRWLQDCLSKHTKCCQENTNWLPTRLLKICGRGASRIELICTDSEPSSKHHGRYLTLSHCWGKLHFFTLTAQTLPQLINGVDVSMLPRTFQDAVSMALFLGFEYLWIDSLCILQDSIEDWRVESALMGDIYSNAVCNLAATGSADGNGGLFVDRQHSFDLSCLIDDPRLFRDSKSSWHTSPVSLQHAILLLDGPLLSRGWVVQERVLARRTLHFGSKQLFWECMCFQACETYPGGLPPTMEAMKGNLIPFEYLQHIFGTKSRNTPLSLKYLDASWRTTVSGYTSCNLTKLEDKLVAISGLARTIQKRHPQFNFVAGMLIESLPNSLRWAAQRGERRKPRPKAYRAPSWSWASVGNAVGITPEPHSKGVVCKILGVDVDAGVDPLGQNVAATLRIEAYLMTVNVRYNATLGSSRSEFCINGVWHADFGIADIVERVRDVDDEPYHALHCLVIEAGDAFRLHQILDCLLIQPTGLKKGEFRRFGVYNFWSHDHRISSLNDIKNAQNEEWLEYESVGEDGKYIVSII